MLQAAQHLEPSGQRFQQDSWTRAPGSGSGAGNGVTATLQGGDLLEKAAINTTIASGTLSPQRAQAMSGRGRGISAAGGQPYQAAALSLVVHPRHPFVPTLRADVRRFQVEGMTWYGGGCDLTPVYLFQEDAQGFHAFWKAVCDAHQPGLYARLKRACDDYFFLPARSEHRGIGGIFFDDLADAAELSAEQFTREVGRKLVQSWAGIAARRRVMSSTEQHREWQLQRRGRYIEFNLLNDRGVRFGMDSPGSMQKVMGASAPPLVAWAASEAEPAEGSPELALLQVLRTPRDWV